jgi:hypothetical protein
MSEPVIVNIVCKKLLSQYNVPETVIDNVVCQKLLLSILYARTCYCQYCIPEAVIAQYVVSVYLHTTYTKEFVIFNYKTFFEMKSEYLTLKIISSCHFVCTNVCIYCL